MVGDGSMTKITAAVCNKLGIALPLKCLLLKMGTKLLSSKQFGASTQRLNDSETHQPLHSVERQTFSSETGEISL